MQRAGIIVCKLPRGLLLAAILGAALLPPPAGAATLKGSKASVILQKNVADASGLTFVRTPAQILQFVNMGLLVPVTSTAHLDIDAEVSYPYARPEVNLFLDDFSRRYHMATAEKLVVTSLTRPLTRQPRNASGYSVHPAGIAIDIRRSNAGASRTWIERELKRLEDLGVLDATRERHPAHYHVAIFPNAYRDFAEGRTPRPPDVDRAATHYVDATPAAAKAAPKPAPASLTVKHRVRKGENLWAIARRYGTSVSRLQTLNHIGSNIFPGQVLKVPASP